MLVLSRTNGEWTIIKVGDTVIRIKIVEVRGDKVRLGFEAPRDVRIDREEVWKLRQETP